MDLLQGIAVNASGNDLSQSEVGLVICAIDLATLGEDSSQQMVQLIPVGENGRVAGVDGRSWEFDPDVFRSANANAKTDYPIDYEHASLSAKNTGAIAPSAGWLAPESIEIRDDGVWGLVEWTDRAANHIRNREFRYTSPVFTYDKRSMKVLTYIGSALTHYPNLGNQKPVANAHDKPNAEEKQMEELLERLKYMLNLPELSTPEEVLGELEKALSRLREFVAGEASNSQLGDDPNLASMLDALSTRIDGLAANTGVDPQAFVPRAEFERVSTELKSLSDSIENERVEKAVNAALDAGKITPASVEWAKEYCRKDPEGFDNFVANTAKVIPFGEEKPGGGEQGAALDETEQAVCSQLGIDPEAYQETKKSEVN